MPRILKKATKSSAKAGDDNQSVSTNSKSQKNVNRSSTIRRNTFRKKRNSSDEMTQTERTRKTKEAVSKNSDRERDQILKIAPRSKTISKEKNLKGIKKSSFCLANFARETIQSNRSSSNRVEITQASRMNFNVKGGIEVAAAPDGLSGFIKLMPGAEKKAKLSLSELQFVVMEGKVVCIFGGSDQKYSVGTTVSIPKGISYGLRNPGREECLLQYQVL